MLRISKQPLQLQNSTHRAYLSMVLDTAWKNKCSTFLAPAVQMWQDHAAKQIDWFLYFQSFTSSTPSETMRSSDSKAGCGKSNLGSRLRWRRPATFSPLRLQHFLWRPLPGRQSFGGGDLMAWTRGPPGCGPPAENRESETTRRDIAPPYRARFCT